MHDYMHVLMVLTGSTCQKSTLEHVFINKTEKGFLTISLERRRVCVETSVHCLLYKKYTDITNVLTSMNI
jgi:hypothetical protein